MPDGCAAGPRVTRVFSTELRHHLLEAVSRSPAGEKQETFILLTLCLRPDIFFYFRLHTIRKTQQPVAGPLAAPQDCSAGSGLARTGSHTHLLEDSPTASKPGAPRAGAPRGSPQSPSRGSSSLPLTPAATVPALRSWCRSEAGSVRITAERPGWGWDRLRPLAGGARRATSHRLLSEVLLTLPSSGCKKSMRNKKFLQ